MSGNIQTMYTAALAAQDKALKNYGYNSPQYKAATAEVQKITNLNSSINAPFNTNFNNPAAVNLNKKLNNNAISNNLNNNKDARFDYSKTKLNKNLSAYDRFTLGVNSATNKIKNAAVEIGNAYTKNNLPQSFYDNIARSLFSNGTSPSTEGLKEQARLQENYAAQRNADAAQNRQIVNRDERQEASKDAQAKAASINEQKVASLGANAGTGAATLARETVSPEFDQLRQRQDTQRREAVQNEDEMYRLYEDAIMRRASADESNIYDYKMQKASDEGEQLAKGIMPPSAISNAKQIQDYINSILSNKAKIEEVPAELKDEVIKAANTQKDIASLISIQNLINKQAGSPIRYILENGIVSYHDIKKENLPDNFTGSSNPEETKKWFESQIPIWQKRFGNTYTSDRISYPVDNNMEHIRYILFDNTTKKPIANNPNETKDYLQQCINMSKGGV